MLYLQRWEQTDSRKRDRREETKCCGAGAREKGKKEIQIRGTNKKQRCNKENPQREREKGDSQENVDAITNSERETKRSEGI